ncbi:MAG: hypothetical protein JO051_18060 [Acidobacteriaceae bacterium]|nr:hypothetical protein [Acidobacteriaceae bacterium]
MTVVRHLTIAATILAATLGGTRTAAATECEVKRVVHLDADVPDVTVVTKTGETVPLRDLVEAFVEPVRIDTGSYEVNVRRKAANLYEIAGRSLQIETRYCYEYVYGQDGILKITSSSGWSVGKLIFE